MKHKACIQCNCDLPKGCQGELCDECAEVCDPETDS